LLALLALTPLVFAVARLLALEVFGGADLVGSFSDSGEKAELSFRAFIAAWLVTFGYLFFVSRATRKKEPKRHRVKGMDMPIKKRRLR